ncbi:MAG: DMT family transporter [SAR324 cluster bacterium]|nr:DMT family transporter [SAR324 cluster bacterium]
MNLKSLVNVMLIGLLFGGGIVSSRFGIGQFEPIVFTGLRLAVAVLAFAGFYLVSHQRHPFPSNWRLWRHSLLLGTFGTALPMTCFIAALQFQSSGVSAIFITTGPAMIALLAHFALPDESLNRVKVSGIVLALGGALFIALNGESGLRDFPQANPLGYILITLSVSCHCVATIYLRKYTHQYRTFDLTGSQILIAMVFILLGASLTMGFDFSRVDLTGLMSLLYSGLFGTFIAFLLYNLTVRDFGPTVAGMSFYVTPIVATLAGVLLLGEALTLNIVIGMSVILAGIALVNYGSRARTLA